MYLVGRDNQLVLRAHVPTLASGVKSGVWDVLPPVSYQRNSLFTIGNNLLTVGSSIRIFDRTSGERSVIFLGALITLTVSSCTLSCLYWDTQLILQFLNL